MESKTCTGKCAKEKPLDEYYVHKGMASGRLSMCKVCKKEASIANRNKNIDQVRAYDRERSRLPHRIKQNSEISQKFRKDFPLKYKAHTALNNAVRDGRVVKPLVCDCCSKEKRLHGHHHDYSKPLDVTWLCVICHKQLRRDLDTA